VTARGWERRDVVRDDQDRASWLRLLDRVALRFDWRIFAWALMRNHWHLFLMTPHPNLSRGMHDLNSGYATLYNRRHRRAGALLQGRFKAILVQEEGYGWTLSRYIHLNPVRARAADSPAQYPWTSYRYYLDPRGAPDWLDWQTVLGEIGQSLTQSRSQYVRFVESGIGSKLKSPLAEAVGGVLLGSPSWVARMKQRIGLAPAQREVPARRRLARRPTLDDVLVAVCAAWGVEAESLQRARRHGNEARTAALYLARECAAIPVTKLAHQFGQVSVSAVSKLLRQAARRRDEDPGWNRRLRALERALRPSDENSKVKT
jgi:REP-associated tyrosine transposase